MKKIVDHGGPSMGDAQFGVTFFTSSQRQESCGTNGLPLTPNSIRILGKSQYLKTIVHQNLVQYVDIIRGKHERIIVVSEYYANNLRKILKNEGKEIAANPERILMIAQDILNGLTYLNKKGLINRNLCLENILFDNQMNLKLFSYGLNYMTNNGKYVSFPIGNAKYIAPEVYTSEQRKGPKHYSLDMWSLGIIIFELATGKELWCDLKLPQLVEKIFNLTKVRCNSVLQILLESEAEDFLQNLHPKIKLLLDKCLELDPTKRVTPEELINNANIFSSQDNLKIANNSSTENTAQNQENNNYKDAIPENVPNNNLNNEYCSPNKFFTSAHLEIKHQDFLIHETDLASQNQNAKDNRTNWDHLGERTFKEVYYLWQLAGGDVISELKKQGLTRKKPAILSLPNSLTLEGESHGRTKERGLLLDETVIVLPLSELRKRLRDILPESYYPLIEFQIPFLSEESYSIKEAAQLPLVIREKDIVYQFHRIVLFERLLKGYPYTKNAIYREALQDIPPFFRAQIWSCLLDISGDVEYIFSLIDKETPTSTDRQIEVDIPRCHQYDELLSSSSGHEKFKRVLKAWVVSNKEYVYWQGLDSLCAPFLYLNFNNEALAFSCLSSFIPRYLYNFFLKDNSVVIQEYLSKFSQLIAFHDPELTNHLDSIEFIPELYAIPWFLTMFSHVFPLNKIFHLWDKLLLGDSSFSLCIGLAILYQLRESLLNSGFNECILLFSDMPEINIESCVKDSVEIYCSTPKSALTRKFTPPMPKKVENSFQKSKSNGSAGFQENDALKAEPIPLAELVKEKCCRISGEDFLTLLDLNRTKFTKPRMIVIDIRNPEDYNRGAIPGSLNIPFNSLDAGDGSLNTTLGKSAEVNMLNENRGKIIAVVGSRGDFAKRFAEILLRLGYPRICVLHRGIDVFRSSNINILVVPSSI